MPRFQILPAEERFYDWFEKGAANVVDAARLLVQMMHQGGDMPRCAQLINEFEHRGDFIVHEVFELLHRTFITPLERGEIQRLTSTIDDVVDHIDAAADAMLLYKVERPTEPCIRLSEMVLASAEQIAAAVPLLRQKGDIPRIRQHVIEVNRLENQADDATRAAVAALIERPDQLFELIRWKEIYSLLEETTDRCEDVADTLNYIVFENS